MGGQRRRLLKQQSSQVKNNNNESLWSNSIHRILRDDSFTLQMVGIGSPTATVFGRLVAQANLNKCCDGPVSVGEVVGTILDEARTFHGVSKVTSRIIPPMKELFRLGSVWILSQQGEGKLPPRRCLAKDWRTIPDDWSWITLRLHYSPPRYPSCWSVSAAMVHEVCSLFSSPSGAVVIVVLANPFPPNDTLDTQTTHAAAGQTLWLCRFE
jgi:hypothetical protein